MGDLYMASNVNRIREAHMIAKGYLDAAEYLKSCEKENGWLMGEYASAYTANLAFACELYFKQLLMIRKIDVKHVHVLKDLFLKISPDIKLKIEAKYNEKMKVELSERAMQPMTLDECLDKYNTAFKEWRYTYEGGKAMNTIAEIHFFVLVRELKEITDEIIEQYSST